VGFVGYCLLYITITRMTDEEIVKRAKNLLQLPELDISVEEAMSVILFFEGSIEEHIKPKLTLIKGGKK
jgi:hypothetical protein